MEIQRRKGGGVGGSSGRCPAGCYRSNDDAAKSREGEAHRHDRGEHCQGQLQGRRAKPHREGLTGAGATTPLLVLR
jgi:hypothetical protein